MSLLEPIELAPLDDLIEQRFWTGTPYHDAATYVVDCSEYAGTDLPNHPELVDRVRETYDRVGLVHMVNTGATEAADMRALARVVMDAEMTYDGGANPRDRIEPNVYEIGAPLEARLPYHHEMAYIGKSTRLISFACLAALPGRGSTFVSDGIASTEALLATEFGQKLRELGVCYHRTLTDRDHYVGEIGYGVYNHWQKSFGTDDPDVAVARAEAGGLVTAWGDHRVLETRYYAAAFEYFPSLDRNMLYSSLADHGIWFDTWPLVQHLPYTERPLHLTFGDDSEFTHDELELFIKVYDDYGTPIDWRRGDVAVICNARFAHGRPEIHLRDGESRKLGVMLGEQYDRVGQRDDKF